MVRKNTGSLCYATLSDRVVTAGAWRSQPHLFSLDLTTEGNSLMPLARINLPAGKAPEYGRAVADAVYEAMIATLKVPGGRSLPGDFRAHPGYPVH
jgi:hypothetical protein